MGCHRLMKKIFAVVTQYNADITGTSFRSLRAREEDGGHHVGRASLRSFKASDRI